MRSIALLAASLTCSFAVLLPARAGDAFKWTDAQGTVHYGDTVPAEMAARATPVDANRDQLTDAEKQAAAARLAQERALLAKRDAHIPNAGGKVSKAAARPASAATACAQAWSDYNASLACFGSHRRGVTGDPLRKSDTSTCKEVPQPDADCHG